MRVVEKIIISKRNCLINIKKYLFGSFNFEKKKESAKKQMNILFFTKRTSL